MPLTEFLCCTSTRRCISCGTCCGTNCRHIFFAFRVFPTTRARALAREDVCHIGDRTHNGVFSQSCEWRSARGRVAQRCARGRDTHDSEEEAATQQQQQQQQREGNRLKESGSGQPGQVVGSAGKAHELQELRTRLLEGRWEVGVQDTTIIHICTLTCSENNTLTRTS